MSDYRRNTNVNVRLKTKYECPWTNESPISTLNEMGVQSATEWPGPLLAYMQFYFFFESLFAPSKKQGTLGGLIVHNLCSTAVLAHCLPDLAFGTSCDACFHPGSLYTPDLMTSWSISGPSTLRVTEDWYATLFSEDLEPFEPLGSCVRFLSQTGSLRPLLDS